MNTSLSHITLLVPSVEASAKVLKAQGIETDEPETFETEGSKEIYVGSYGTQKGLLLLVEAISEGPYRRALTKRGPSLHHVAIDVLNVDEFAAKAQSVGWKLHPESANTIAHKTVWLYLKGVPTLIEVHQKKELSSRPVKVSHLELPMAKEHLALFEGIGLGDVVSAGKELCLKVDGHKFTFAELAFLK
jgi:4-hydroxyphenylpyruvate dioxygenase-like putative hemolysin